MKQPVLTRISGSALVIAGLAALTVALAAPAARAADPDRYLSGDERFDEAAFEESIQVRIESALEGLESLEGLGEGLEGLSDDISEMIEDALREGSVVVDGDWPDRVWIRGGGTDFEFDADAFARQMERMSRQIERHVHRNYDVQIRGGRHHARVWRVDDVDRDRQDIEAEMRDLQRELRRLQHELEDLEIEGDI